MEYELFDPEMVRVCNQKTANDPISSALVANELNKHFSIIPLNSNSKVPSEHNWTEFCVTKRSYCDSDFYWRNVGIACGTASKLIVLDIDDMEKFAKYKEKYNVREDYAETFIVQTGSGGYHFYYEYPDDGKCYKSRSYQELGFDIRADGGQVVAPGSIHPETNQVYRIHKNIIISKAPSWLLSLSLNKIHINNEADLFASKVDLRLLPIPEKCKKNIVKSVAKGHRSENIMSVLIDLLSYGVKEEIIHSIFADLRFHIGEKYREKGIPGDKYLSHEIEKAKEFISSKQVPEIPNSVQDCFDVVSLGQIADNDPRLEFVVDGLWSLNDTLMIFGYGGSGKSLFALQLAISLADPPENGFLGTFPVSSCKKVLFLQSEVSSAGINDRIKKIYGEKGMPSSVRESIKFIALNNCITVSDSFTNSQFVSMLKNTVKTNNFDVIIIDPLISYHVEDENNNNAMRRVLDSIKSLCQELKVSILIVHHSGKSYQGENNSGGRGASSIGDWASSSLELKADSKDQYFKLIHKKARDFRKFSELRLIRSDNLVYSVVDNDTKKYDKSVSTVINALNIVGDECNQKTLYTEICKICESEGRAISKNTAISWIEKAVNFCAITRNDNNKFYSLCS